MPVTAKLSRKFYDKFGDEVANELVDWFNAVDMTYRSDLRELNELNFQRFDAKVEQRFVEFAAATGRRFTDFEARIDAKLVDLEARVDSRLVDFEARVEKRLSNFESKFEERFGDIDKRFGDIDKRFADIDKRFRALEATTAALDAKIDLTAAQLRTEMAVINARTIKWMFAFWVGTLAPIAGLVFYLT